MLLEKCAANGTLVEVKTYDQNIATINLSNIRKTILYQVVSHGKLPLQPWQKLDDCPKYNNIFTAQ